MKKPKKIAISLGIVWLLTFGIHVGTLPGGIPSIGTKDGYYWDEFIEGKRPHYMLGFMEVPKYQAGIPFLFTYSGGAVPASVDLALDTLILNFTGHPHFQANRISSSLLSIFESSLPKSTSHTTQLPIGLDTPSFKCGYFGHPAQVFHGTCA